TVTGPDRIYLINVDSGDERVLTSPPEAVLGDSSPAFSPKGEHLAFVRSLSHGVDDIYIQSLRGAVARRLTFDRTQIGSLTWTGDGDSIVYGANRDGVSRLWRIPAKGGSPEPIYATGQNVSQPSISRQGSRLVYEEYFKNVNLKRLDLSKSVPP